MDRIVAEVEELAPKIFLLKTRFAAQTASVKVNHFSEVISLHQCIADFRRAVEELEECDELGLDRSFTAVRVAWHSLMRALEVLLGILPDQANDSRNVVNYNLQDSTKVFQAPPQIEMLSSCRSRPTYPLTAFLSVRSRQVPKPYSNRAALLYCVPGSLPKNHEASAAVIHSF